MEVLHRLWSSGVRGGLKGARALALVVALLPACREEGNPHPPDRLLQDSLGLTPDDRVHRVLLVSRDGTEVVEPREVVLAPGGYVEFFTRDRRVRTVSFVLDSLGREQGEFLRTTGQDRSPPLVEPDSRFVVSFARAPPGRYPFVVEGSGVPAYGSVLVEDGGSG